MHYDLRMRPNQSFQPWFSYCHAQSDSVPHYSQRTLYTAYTMHGKAVACHGHNVAWPLVSVSRVGTAEWLLWWLWVLFFFFFLWPPGWKCFPVDSLHSVCTPLGAPPPTSHPFSSSASCVSLSASGPVPRSQPVATEQLAAHRAAQGECVRPSTRPLASVSVCPVRVLASHCWTDSLVCFLRKLRIPFVDLCFVNISVYLFPGVYRQSLCDIWMCSMLPLVFQGVSCAW